MFGRRVWRVLVAVLLVAGIALIAHAAYIPAKAWLAQHLLLAAWEKTLRGEPRVQPWPWADTWPVARLSAPAHQVDLIVLAGDTGRTLAFAPGLNLGLAAPGEAGSVLISGHRDTHFSFLRGVMAGERLELQLGDGRRRAYRVSDAHVINAAAALLDPEMDRLILVTCYPFDALAPGGPLRFVVSAEPIEDGDTVAGFVVAETGSGR